MADEDVKGSTAKRNHCTSCGEALESNGTPCFRCYGSFPETPHSGVFEPDRLFDLGLSPSAASRGWEPLDPEDLHRLLPQYRVERILGCGGMGAVYQGSQERLGRSVAIKLLPAEMAADAAFVTRFEREASTLAHVSHPNIVQIHDSGRTAEGHPYFVMEFIDGTDLQEMLRDGPLPAELTLGIISQICEALQFAHGKGVVHRDIKPANVLVTRDGIVKLADFGLARPLDPDAAAALTQQVMGTPDYMAPEQKEGGGDHRVDLYALGVMLYEMLCGTVPRGTWRPPSDRSAVDPRLDRIVAKAMQDEPARRYQQAGEVKTDIDGVRHTAAPPARRKQVLLMATTSLAAVAGAGAWWQSRHQPAVQAGFAPLPVTQSEASAGRPWVNSLGLGFVPVPDTKTLLCTTEARESDWAAFLEATGHPWQRFRDPTVSDAPKPPDHPASGVSWHDANAFCTWLTEKERREGKIGPEKRYRLPTDKEWSLAADLQEPAYLPFQNSGLTPKFGWGTTFPPPRDRVNVGDVGPSPASGMAGNLANDLADLPVLTVDSYPETCPVKAFPPDARGLWGLTGNVSEWVWDKWSLSHNEHGPRVTRGGGWFTRAKSGMPWLMRHAGAQLPRLLPEAILPSAKSLALGNRDHAQPGERWPHVGFRPALAATDETLPSAPRPPIQGVILVNSLGMHLMPAVDAPPVDIYFSRWETRIRDYRVFATETNRPMPVASFPQDPDHPVVMVTLEDCESFCRWLTEKEKPTGMIPPDLVYRLPSAREWLGSLILPPLRPGVVQDSASFPISVRENLFDLTRSAVLGAGSEGQALSYNDGHPWTAPVGSYAHVVSRVFPFYDVGGNVIERQLSPRLFAGSRDTGNAVFGHSYASATTEPAKVTLPRLISDEPSEEIGFRVVLGKPVEHHFLTKAEALQQSKTHAGHTYAWVVSSAPREDAETFARSIGGQLATADDEAEREFLARDGPPGIWLTGDVAPTGSPGGFIVEFDTLTP